jgi:hypothetical protein
VLQNGIASAFQAVVAGSIPATRLKKQIPRQEVENVFTFGSKFRSLLARGRGSGSKPQ